MVVVAAARRWEQGTGALAAGAGALKAGGGAHGGVAAPVAAVRVVSDGLDVRRCHASGRGRSGPYEGLVGEGGCRCSCAAAACSRRIGASLREPAWGLNRPWICAPSPVTLLLVDLRVWSSSFKLGGSHG